VAWCVRVVALPTRRSGCTNAASYVLHSEGDKADDKQDAAKGDNTDDKVSPDVNE
jgi:hypothetical protein